MRMQESGKQKTKRPRIWFSSDHHFNHINILNYGRNKFFSSIDEMNRALIENHNSVVDEEDEVYFLGDVVMGKRADSLPLLSKMNGRKHLILGNHCYPHPSNKQKIIDKWTPEYAKYFESMQTELEIEITDTKVLLSHFPATLDHANEVRYDKYRPTYDGIILHGHLHVEGIFTEPNHIHVGIDSSWVNYGVRRYHPIPIEAIEQIITELNQPTDRPPYDTGRVY